MLEAGDVLRRALTDRGLAALLDDRDDLRPGAKHFEWEQKGVPVRIELGPRDVAAGVCVTKRRDRDPKEKTTLPLAGAPEAIEGLMDEIQRSLYQRAKDRRDARTVRVDTWEDFKNALAGTDGVGNFVLAHWDGTTETEKKIKEETRATIRCIPLDGEEEPGVCVRTGRPSARRVLFAEAY